MKENSEYDDARGAASAHPAAVRAEVLPYAVAHHLPAAPPPKQQPALQPAAYPAHHGSRCEQRDLRARVSGPRDAVKTRAQQSSKRKAPLTATPLLLALACCSSDAERLREALQACIQKALSMILALRLTVDAKRCDVVRQRVADETRRGRAARFICPAACACSPDVHMGRPPFPPQPPPPPKPLLKPLLSPAALPAILNWVPQALHFKPG